MFRRGKYWREKAAMWRDLFFVTDKMLQRERENTEYFRKLFYKQKENTAYWREFYYENIDAK